MFVSLFCSFCLVFLLELPILFWGNTLKTLPHALCTINLVWFSRKRHYFRSCGNHRYSSLWSFWVVLLLASGTFFMCVHWKILFWILKEDPLQISGVHRLCSILSFITVLITTMVSFDSQLDLVNSWNPQVLPNFTSFMLQPRNFFNTIRFSKIRAILIFCLSHFIICCCLMFSVLIIIVLHNRSISSVSVSVSNLCLYLSIDCFSGGRVNLVTVPSKKFKKILFVLWNSTSLINVHMLSFICSPLTFQP